ncbi:MAG: Ppx/GppA family phosphatase [Natronospirillum sp.]|uniref:Ppx/GppA phosphatase family protein n=1 Tax=Natronospirillum sp. TaxID=2812955 RepID=UPI0026008F75|nr:Ppx/GppA phosphatase family protein [Natronospirillum sp.]MCH8553053.1 Ppx/GppA family phosphatase [Natronospirillum sp.]
MFTLTRLFRRTPDDFAALDLGSNSFHMVIARKENGELRLLDRLREPVRLGFGLDQHGQISLDAQRRALDCLARFGERLIAFPSGSVRCVGTRTLRMATKSEDFLAAAEQALGHPIEVITGSEEARLIYEGVAHSLAGQDGTRLVADIGGGSTELIIGQQFDIAYKESLNMGCVAVTRDFFPDGKVTSGRVQKALLACAQETDPILRALKRHGWKHEVGASGTIKTAHRVCVANGWAQPGITLKGLQEICARYEQHGQVEGLKLDGLSADRDPVFLGGVIVLRTLFETLGLKSMEASQGALREGLLFDLVGRYDDRDIREQSVQRLSERFHVDSEQAERVARTATDLVQQVDEDWELNLEEAKRYLGWASWLLEVGLDIAHDNFHKHSAYICEHSDLAGFSMQEQQILAFLVLAQRRKFPAKTYRSRKSETGALDKSIQRLAVLLRLAVILHRARAEHTEPPIKLRVGPGKKEITLYLDQGWLAQQPLVAADLATEIDHLKAINLTLTVQPN